MIVICQNCKRKYNVYFITDQDSNAATSMDKYTFPIFIDKNKYLGIKCHCGAINIQKV